MESALEDVSREFTPDSWDHPLAVTGRGDLTGTLQGSAIDQASRFPGLAIPARSRDEMPEPEWGAEAPTSV